MNCKACNTRLPGGARVCPHCGHAQPRNQFIDQPSRSQPPQPQDPGSSASGRLSPSTLSAYDGGGKKRATETEPSEAEVELPLEDAMAIGGARGRPERSGRGRSAEPASRRGASSRSEGASGRRDRSMPGASRPAARGSDDASDAAPAALPMDADALRHLIGEQPDLLEPGLRVLGEEGRRRVGIGYGTEVGEIDLLARSDSGDWVVVMVAEGNPGPQLVSDVLHRVGWVRKHLSEEGDHVRAILLIERMDEALGYAAAAVADTIAFLTWRVSIRFESLEV